MRLLIVDDEVMSVDGLMAMLDWRALGFDEVLAAYNIFDAEPFIRQGVDLLLCDIEMPLGSGLELMDWVRENGYRLECIFLTCYARFDYARQAVRHEAADYLLKPVSPEDLERVVRKVARRIEERRQQERLAPELPEPQAGADTGDAVRQVKRYVEEHLGDEMTRETVAAAIHLNPDYLNRLFKQATGVSITKYATGEKMRAAKRLLLKTDLPISAVGAKVGYDNFSHFSFTFKKFTGQTPNDYRTRFASP